VIYKQGIAGAISFPCKVLHLVLSLRVNTRLFLILQHRIPFRDMAAWCKSGGLSIRLSMVSTC